MKKFKINGKNVESKEFTFNLICDMEDMGFPIADIAKKPTSAVRAYLAICMDISLDEAGKEIEQHMIGGGSLNPLMTAMSYEMKNSDFFQALTKGATANNQTAQE